MDRVTLTRPDDWHLHLRDGEALKSVLADSARRFARAIVMPNLRPPVTTVVAAAEYRDRIVSALPPGSDFEPLMTLYLTDNTRPAEIYKAKASGIVQCGEVLSGGGDHQFRFRCDRYRANASIRSKPWPKRQCPC